MKTNKTVLLISLAILILLGSCTQKQEIINIKDHGILPNTGENMVGIINEIINGLDSFPTTIIFPKGRYDFYPDSNFTAAYFETNTYDVNPKNLAILLRNKKNVIIDAQGSDFIYHGHIQPFTIDNSENICIENVNIDWDHPLTAEALVLEADSSHILIQIDTIQFPYLLNSQGLQFVAETWKENWRLSKGSWLIEIDKNHIIPAHTGGHGCVNGNLEKVYYSNAGSGKVLMKGSFTKTPTVGNYLIMRHSTRDHAGIFNFHSKNIKLENINVYHTSGLGILSQYCENLEFRNVNMIPNPKKNRYLSGHDDGLHFMGCKGEIIIDSCNAQGLMDDPINIHGTCVPVKGRIDKNSLKCFFAHSMSTGLIWAKEGDSIGFIKKENMQTKEYGVIKSFEILDNDNFVLRFAHALPENIDSSYTLENLSWTPNATITNCFVGSCRARGYLISTPGKVLIENNIFETSGSAILIAGDANYWYESGAVKDVIIRNNEFRSPCNSSYYQFCNAIISIFPEIPKVDSMIPFHKNIRIENNSFFPSDYPVLYALSVDGLKFNNNTITRTYDYEPWHFQKYNLLLDACRNVEILGNSLGKDVLGKNILLKRMGRAEVSGSLKAFEVNYN